MDRTILKTPRYDSLRSNINETIRKNDTKLWMQKTIVTKSNEKNFLANIDLKQEIEAFR